MQRLVYGGFVLVVLLRVSAYGQTTAVPSGTNPQSAATTNPGAMQIGFKGYFLGAPVKQVTEDARYRLKIAYSDFGVANYEMVISNSVETLAGYPLTYASLDYYKDELVEICMTVKGDRDVLVASIKGKCGEPTGEKGFRWDVGNAIINVFWRQTEPENVTIVCSTIEGRKQLTKVMDYEARQRAKKAAQEARNRAHDL